MESFKRESAPTPEAIKDLCDKLGFEEKEAELYWHLQRAQHLMYEILEEQAAGNKETVADPAVLIADELYSAAQNETRVFQHFSMIRRDLGMRVLQRRFPEGWGSTLPENATGQ